MEHVLEELIAGVEAKLAGLPSPAPDLPFHDLYQALRDREKAAAQALDLIAIDYGATFKRDWAGTRIRLAGITATSTSGDIHAMRNWLTAARKKLPQLNSEISDG